MNMEWQKLSSGVGSVEGFPQCRGCGTAEVMEFRLRSRLIVIHLGCRYLPKLYVLLANACEGLIGVSQSG